MASVQLVHHEATVYMTSDKLNLHDFESESFDLRLSRGLLSEEDAAAVLMTASSKSSSPVSQTLSVSDT